MLSYISYFFEVAAPQIGTSETSYPNPFLFAGFGIAAAGIVYFWHRHRKRRRPAANTKQTA